MSLKPGERSGVEMHDHRDQFIRVESGRATVTMGPSEDEVAETHHLEDDGRWSPGGTWHNVINNGDAELSSTPSTRRRSTPTAPCTRRRPTPTPRGEHHR